MAKWIEFRLVEQKAGDKRTTKSWEVVSKQQQKVIGWISWFSGWRKYCFFPDAATVFEQVCLRDIADFCERETKAHYATVKQQRAPVA
jgi:hypothetical protein